MAIEVSSTGSRPEGLRSGMEGCRMESGTGRVGVLSAKRSLGMTACAETREAELFWAAFVEKAVDQGGRMGGVIWPIRWDSSSIGWC
eukprot:439602-Amorphochlora_amoeboformis.AAC.1